MMPLYRVQFSLAKVLHSQDLLLVEVTPLSMDLETAGGVMTLQSDFGTHLGGMTLATVSWTSACRTSSASIIAKTCQATSEADSLFEGIDYSYLLPRARSEELCIDYSRNSMGPVKDACEIITSVEQKVMSKGSNAGHGRRHLRCVSANCQRWHL